MKPLVIVGVTLIVTAILVHLCFCEWSDHGARSAHLVGFVYARSSHRDHMMIAGLCGLALPVLVAGTGVALVCWGQSKEPKGGDRP